VVTGANIVIAMTDTTTVSTSVNNLAQKLSRLGTTQGRSEVGLFLGKARTGVHEEPLLTIGVVAAKG
jgi:hypothetical protein